jgi:hypothetical protein
MYYLTLALFANSFKKISLSGEFGANINKIEVPTPEAFPNRCLEVVVS